MKPICYPWSKFKGPYYNPASLTTLANDPKVAFGNDGIYDVSAAEPQPLVIRREGEMEVGHDR